MVSRKCKQSVNVPSYFIAQGSDETPVEGSGCNDLPENARERLGQALSYIWGCGPSLFHHKPPGGRAPVHFR